MNHLVVPCVRSGVLVPCAFEVNAKLVVPSHPPHFSRLSLCAFVNDAASRAQVDVESAAHDRHRCFVA